MFTTLESNVDVVGGICMECGVEVLRIELVYKWFS